MNVQEIRPLLFASDFAGTGEPFIEVRVTDLSGAYLIVTLTIWTDLDKKLARQWDARLENDGDIMEAIGRVVEAGRLGLTKYPGP